jgi:hypothetical protein
VRVTKLSYQEGDWFAVPLDRGGYALGIIARMSALGVLLGYFFGPRRSELPTLADARELTADQAIWIARFSDRGLRGRTRSRIAWPVLGRLDDWNRYDWKMPTFGRKDSVTGVLYRIFYLDDDPDSRPRRQRAASYDQDEVAALPTDGVASPDYVEKWLDEAVWHP